MATPAEIREHFQWLQSSGLTGDALNQRIYDDAKKFGLTPEQLAAGTGLAVSDINGWATSQGLPALGAPAPAPAQDRAWDGAGRPTAENVRTRFAELQRSGLTEEQVQQQLYDDAIASGTSLNTLAQGTGLSRENISGWVRDRGLNRILGMEPGAGGGSAPPATGQGPAPGTPPTGLIGAESALTGGLQGAESIMREGLDYSATVLRDGEAAAQDMLNQNQNMLAGETLNIYNRAGAPIGEGRDAALEMSRKRNEQAAAALGGMQGAEQAGLAEALMAAQSGAQGYESQKQAFDEFTASPGQEFLREQAELGTTRNAAAIGGLGGGRVRQELQRQAMGLAQQDFAGQFDRLGQVADRGRKQSSALAQLRASQGGQEASIAAGAGQQLGALGGQLGGQYLGDFAKNRSTMAALPYQTGQSLAGLGTLGAQVGAQGYLQTGQDLAAGRTAAGNQIANAISGTTQGVANLNNQQGAGVSDLLGNQGNQIASILSGAGTGMAGQQNQLASLLANISTGQGSQASGLGGVPGVQQTGPSNSEQAGQYAAAIGALALAFSDRRLKTNIRPAGRTAGGHSWYTWDWRDGSGSGEGVIAQEMPPELVHTGPGGYLQVNYAGVA